MDAQKKFVERRRAAHVAGTQNVADDPLVKAAMDAWRDSIEIMARWHERRQPKTEDTSVVHTPIMSRRQAD